MASRATVQPIRDEYERVKSSYLDLARVVVRRLKTGLKRHGIQADIQYRVKDADSLVKKIYKRKYSALSDVTDLAGVRVIVKTTRDHKNACSIIEEMYEGATVQDKTKELGDKLMGYRGVHYQVSPRFRRPALSGLSCEVQVRTTAEHLWNDFSHELFYKSDLVIPNNLRRPFQRLVALVEIFDSEVMRTMDALAQEPAGASWSLLQQLETHFVHLVDDRYDRELSLMLLDSLAELVQVEAQIDVSEIEQFVTDQEDKLKEVFYRQGRLQQTNPFILQPEAILIWHLLDTRLHDITAVWSNNWDPDLLSELATIWGLSIPGQD